MLYGPQDSMLLPASLILTTVILMGFDVNSSCQVPIISYPTAHLYIYQEFFKLSLTFEYLGSITLLRHTHHGVHAVIFHCKPDLIYPTPKPWHTKRITSNAAI